jgi:DNA repair protein RecN (Recombination protein N)
MDPEQLFFMLKSIKLENFATFKEATADLPPGLTLISGESGSGKSSLIEGLFWGLGMTNKRGDKDSRVELTFLVDGEDVVFTREGNNFLISKAKVAKGLFQEKSQNLISFSQQEARMTFTTKEDFLPIIDKRLPEITEVKKLYLAIKELEAEKSALEALNPEDLDYLTELVEELSQLDLKGQDETEIIVEKRRQNALLKSEEQLDKALDILNKKGLINQILSLSKALEGEESLQALQKRVDGLLEEFRDLEAVIFSQKTGQDQEALLDKLEDRLIKIRSLARKYRTQPDNLLNFLEASKIKLSQIEEIDANKQKLELKLQKTRQDFIREAEILNELRLPIIEEINTIIQENLTDLLMGDIKVQLQLEDSSFSERGNKSLKLLIGELGKRSLSGGETSRLLLAINIANNNLDKIMVFDEIDLGIGGATAHQVGKKLAKLGKNTQLLVITHQPQVAAHGTNHLLIEKFNSSSQLKILSPEEKIQEIARMISGDLITEESLKAAAKLIEAAI